MRNLIKELPRLRVQRSRAEKQLQRCGLTNRLVMVVVAYYALSGWDLPLSETVGRMLREQGGAAMGAIAQSQPCAC